jgi:hypothetical protein
MGVKVQTPIEGHESSKDEDPKQHDDEYIKHKTTKTLHIHTLIYSKMMEGSDDESSSARSMQQTSANGEWMNE